MCRRPSILSVVGIEPHETTRRRLMSVLAKNLDRPDEHLRMPNGNGEGSIVNVGGMTVVRGELQPGWRWSNDLRPVAGTTSCEVPHTGLMLEGTFHIEMDDGTSIDLAPGDVYVIPAGHDAWVVGDEAVRTLDWSSANVDFNEIVRQAQHD
jgi:hypothetical protein